METEPSAVGASRRAQKIWKLSGELLLASAFAGSILWARSIVDASGPGSPAAVLGIVLPILVLTGWWVHIIIAIRRMDELEQAIEVRSMAMACAATVWITTVWGMMQVFAGAPGLPLVMVAPLAAVIYGVIRFAVGVRYR
jgi:hypothetical protein